MPIYAGRGDGTFQSLTSVQVPPHAFAVIAGDFNGDGILDLVTESAITPGVAELTIHLGNGDGTFQPPRILPPLVNGVCVFGRPLLAADFNGDGITDVAFCTDTSIGILIGKGDGTFEPALFYGVGTQGTFTFTAGDFNSDGKTDLIVSHENADNNDHRFSIFLGNGDGTFVARTVVSLPGGYVSELPIMVGDFNSDGLLDFIMQPPSSTIAIYIQR